MGVQNSFQYTQHIDMLQVWCCILSSNVTYLYEVFWQNQLYQYIGNLISYHTLSLVQSLLVAYPEQYQSKRVGMCIALSKRIKGRINSCILTFCRLCIHWCHFLFYVAWHCRYWLLPIFLSFIHENQLLWGQYIIGRAIQWSREQKINAWSNGCLDLDKISILRM